jgi:CRP/FNR family transcriptional regulator, cyclic AMP receptor protein
MWRDCDFKAPVNRKACMLPNTKSKEADRKVRVNRVQHSYVSGDIVPAKEGAMFLPKSDMFKDLRQEAVSEISEIAAEESHPKGTVLFSAADPATYFYLLVEGKIGLTVGDGPSSHYTVNRIGESFGWSSVVGRDVYSASATCLAPTKVMKIDRAALEKVFDAHARSGRVFYKGLAKAMGERWLDLHRMLMSGLDDAKDVSFGTGQITGTKED